MHSRSQFHLFWVLVTRKDATELLAESSSHGLRFPILTIPAHARPVEELTQAIENLWNLKTFCLFTLPANDASDGAAAFIAVLEAFPPSETLPDGMEWRSIASLGPNFDNSSVERALETLARWQGGQLHEPFARAGWFRTLTEWVGGVANRIGLRLNGNFRQLNASSTFSLVRFETNGPALWFKAVGHPNLREYSIAHALVEAVPEFLPRLLGSRLEWRAWLSVEAEGTQLSADSSQEDWRRAASCFARLQIATFGRALHLLDAGCRDLRIHALMNLLAPFFDLAEELMGEQTEPSPAPLSRDSLCSLRTQIESSLDCLARFDMPDVLCHLDLNPGNILVGASRCVFLDWAEAAVGPPFLALECLRQHWKKSHGRNSQAERALVSSYNEEWRSVLSAARIDAARRLAPLLAVFAAASAAVDPSRSSSENSASVSRVIGPYLRGLTRRMKREADSLRERRVLCVP
jgi:hypothetical protein